MNKRVLACKIMDCIGWLKLMHINKKIMPSSDLTILAYHRIIDYDSYEAFELDEEVISATPDSFEQQVRWLKDNYRIINFETLRNEKCPHNSLIITFDDGYKDNFTYAYPILRKHNISATIFLSTGYIGTNQLFWWDEVSLLLKKTQKNILKIVFNKHSIEFRLFSPSNRKAAILSILKLLKTIPDEEKERILKQLRLETEVHQNASSSISLNWDEIREMSRNGIEFGSHSVHHPIMTNLSLDVMKYEIEESKKEIEKEIGKEIIVFSYPVGGFKAFNAQTTNALKEAGYSYAAIYEHGTNSNYDDQNNFCLKRLHMERTDDFSVFKSKILLPKIIKY